MPIRLSLVSTVREYAPCKRGHSVGHPLGKVFAGSVDQHLSYDFGVGARGEGDAHFHELGAQLFRVDNIAVVSQGQLQPPFWAIRG